MTMIQDTDSRTLALTSAELDAQTAHGRLVAEWRVGESHVDLVHYDGDDRAVIETSPGSGRFSASAALRAMHDLLDEAVAETS